MALWYTTQIRIHHVSYRRSNNALQYISLELFAHMISGGPPVCKFIVVADAATWMSLYDNDSFPKYRHAKLVKPWLQHNVCWWCVTCSLFGADSPSIYVIPTVLYHLCVCMTQWHWSWLLRPVDESTAAYLAAGVGSRASWLVHTSLREWVSSQSTSHVIRCWNVSNCITVSY